MNRKQKIVIGMGSVAAILFGIADTWTDAKFSVSIPTDFELLRGWGISDAKMEGDCIPIAFLLVVAATAISVFALRNKKPRAKANDDTAPIPPP